MKKQHKLIIFCILIALLSLITTGQEPPKEKKQNHPPYSIEEIVTTWVDLGEAKSYTKWQQWEYPGVTFMPEIGIRGLWLRIHERITLDGLSKLSGEPVYIAGPHKEIVHLHSETFGHYNPAFLKWVRDAVIPRLTEPMIQKKTQKRYNSDFKLSFALFIDTLELVTLQTHIPTLSNSPNTVSSINKHFYGHHLPKTYTPKKSLFTFSDILTTIFVKFWQRRQQEGSIGLMAQCLFPMIKTYDPKKYQESLSVYAFYISLDKKKKNQSLPSKLIQKITGRSILNSQDFQDFPLYRNTLKSSGS